MLSGSFRTLHFAVRPRVLCRYLGQVLVMLAGLTAVPAIVAVLGDRTDIALRYLAVIFVLGGLGGAGARLDCTDRIQANEALVVSALVFLISGLAMAFPLTGYGIAPLDAVFEAISGVTTTGLSTLGTVQGRPRSFLFARAWLQWVGGLGVVVLSLAFVIPSGVAAKRLGFDDREAADYVGGTRGNARRILLVYVLLTAGGFGLCALAGMHWFDALAYVLAAVSTGGFSPSDASLGGLGPAGRAAVSAICLAGATSFSLYYGASLRSALRSSRLWTLLALTGFGSVLLAVWAASPMGHPSLEAWSRAAWMAISAQTTSGFSVLAVGELPSSGKLVLIGGMLIGGDVGSTAGGLKILRFVILVQLVFLRVLRVSMPNSSQLALRVEGARVQRDEVEAAAALALAWAGVILFSWLIFMTYGYDPLDSLFEVVSAVGTVGLSSGTTGPGLEPPLKGLLCLDMLMGRVELFAFFVLMFPGTWIGRRRASQ